MDNVKNDRYYIQKIRNDLQFIVQHMKDVDIEELNANEILLDINANIRMYRNDHLKMYKITL